MMNEIDLSRVDLNLLVLFEAVEQERHVGRAAERLRLSASAVSHGLGRLRQMLNDPLFLKTPKGVTPTARALDLQAPIAEALARVRGIVSSAAPFDPAASQRRFVIGAPDAISAVILPPLLHGLSEAAPGVSISVRQLLATHGDGGAPAQTWRSAFLDLDARALDIAIIPSAETPDRFHKRHLYTEDFVLVARAGHAYARAPSLDAYCGARHLVVSETGDPYGFVDRVLAQHGRARRTVLTAPNFMFALAMVAQSDLVCAVPRRFAAAHAGAFGVTALEPPLELEVSQLHALAPKPAMMDAGVCWLFELLQSAAPGAAKQS